MLEKRYLHVSILNSEIELTAACNPPFVPVVGDILTGYNVDYKVVERRFRYDTGQPWMFVTIHVEPLR